MTYEPKGTRFFYAATNRQMVLVQDKEHPFDGWLCYRHPDGQWVTLRKATDDDIARIEAAQLCINADSATAENDSGGIDYKQISDAGF